MMATYTECIWNRLVLLKLLLLLILFYTSILYSLPLQVIVYTESSLIASSLQPSLGYPSVKRHILIGFRRYPEGVTELITETPLYVLVLVTGLYLLNRNSYTVEIFTYCIFFLTFK